jgi:hypothetical protein
VDWIELAQDKFQYTSGLLKAVEFRDRLLKEDCTIEFMDTKII